MRPCVSQYVLLVEVCYYIGCIESLPQADFYSHVEQDIEMLGPPMTFLSGRWQVSCHDDNGYEPLNL